MSSLNAARQPYYVAVATYLGLFALIALGQNTAASGVTSDLALGELFAAGAVAVWSLFYLVHSTVTDDAVLDFGGLQIGKVYFYGAVAALCGVRCWQAYEMNHNLTGLGSLWGVLWLAASLAIGVWTWFNYQSYQKAHLAPMARR